MPHPPGSLTSPFDTSVPGCWLLVSWWLSQVQVWSKQHHLKGTEHDLHPEHHRAELGTPAAPEVAIIL